MLPRSNATAWLPLVKLAGGQTVAEDPAVWRQHLQALDDQLVAESALVQEPAAAATTKQQPEAGKTPRTRKLRSWARRQPQADPAGSSASLTGKRGPSPEAGPSGGKAQRRM